MPAPPKTFPLPRRRLLLSLAAVVVLLSIAGGAYAVLDPRGDAHAEVADGPPSSVPVPAPDAPLTVLELEEIVVDIPGRSTSGTPIHRFLKADYAIVHPTTPEVDAHLDGMRPYVRDAFVDYTRLLREPDLVGSDGMAQIRADLLLRARAILGPDLAVEILIADLVLQ
ncbi:hypothetical protein JQC91_05055 [Jannaschia sp. Os4]|uniref:flagellar basal body-associated FliL family protein n=1 Tax=Jannaschia sp. Os4 TaxID=2807617 RepID=UPI00193A57FC|nr:flagellar basal body-associated FliL family protein [Jannaschia sp. Os4]MBM2575667.1 hypothetical protein [Jannaschia sp. Os4]